MNAALPHIDDSWTLFLDRDGVINTQIIDGYVMQWSEFEFIDGVFEAMASFAESFGRIVIVTNQQCIGKGWVTQDEIDAINDNMCDLISDNGGRIDAVLVCPQLATEPENYRKPNPQMAFMAKELMPDIDFAKSIMVGDKDTDILFGKNAGMITVKLAGHSDLADYNFDTLKDFSMHIR